MASSRAMRALIRALLVFGVVLVLLLAGVVAFIEPLVRFGLQVAGLEDVRFQQLSLGPGRLEVEGLEVGPVPGSRLGRLRIGFALSELLRGRVEQVEIEGLELRGRIVDGRVELMGLETGAGEGAEAAWLPVPWPRRVSLDAARIEIDTAAGQLVLPLSGELRPAAAHADWSLAIDDARLVADPGTLARGDLELRGQVPLDRPLTLDAISAQGRLALRADDASVPDVASGLSGAGEIALTLDQGRLEAETRDLRLEIETLGEALRPLGEALPAPWRLALGTDEAPLRLAATLAGDEIAVLLDGATRLVTALPQAEASLALDLIAGQDGTLRAIRPSRATVELSALEWRDARLTRGRIELTASGTPDRLSGTIALEAAGEGAPIPGLTVNDASIRQRIDVLIADGTLTLSLPEPALLQAASLAWAEDLRTGPLTLHLEGGDGPLLEADLPDGALGAWQEALVARLEPMQVTTRTGGAPLALSVEADRLAVRLEGAGTELAQGHASLHAGRARLPETALVLEGIDSEVVFDQAGLVPDQVIPVGIGAIRQERSPPWFAPLTASGTLRPTDGQLVFDARLRRIDGGVQLQVAGEHELTSGRGRASVDLAPVTFSPGGLQPVALAPAHGDLLSEVTGTLALDGSVRWQPGATLGVDVALLIDQIGFGLGPARFEQVNGVVRFDQLWPLSTLPGQQLAVGLVDVGLPLTRGFAIFRLLPDGTLAVEQLRWRAAGGIVRAEPFRIGSDASGITVTLRAEGLDLAQIFALTRLDGLTGEGTINGVLPIRISGGEAVVTGGELVATRPGRLRYRPAEPPPAVAAGGESMGLLLEALENFRYDALRITLDGRTDAAMDIGLHLKGANPDLYDGYPIEFNFALEGELANVLRQGLAGYQIPDQIQERMQSFPR